MFIISRLLFTHISQRQNNKIIIIVSSLLYVWITGLLIQMFRNSHSGKMWFQNSKYQQQGKQSNTEKVKQILEEQTKLEINLINVTKENRKRSTNIDSDILKCFLFLYFYFALFLNCQFIMDIELLVKIQIRLKCLKERKFETNKQKIKPNVYLIRKRGEKISGRKIKAYS